MKKMIITGVNGFIGRCAMEYFSKDYEITGIDLADRYCEDGAEIHYYQCNMSKDSQELANIFTGVQPDVILHCAGSANVGASIVNPMADLDGNLHSLYQLLLALKSFEKRPKIIFLSSAGVYGNPKQLPITEKDALAPISPYGVHKQMGEELRKQLLWDIYQKYLNTGRIDLFGTGNETRDFIHISDILRALELILAYQGSEEIFNVANGEEVSIRELAEIYAKQLGENTDIVRFNGETKVGDPQNWRADISLLKKIGYEKKMDQTDCGSHGKFSACRLRCRYAD